MNYGAYQAVGPLSVPLTQYYSRVAFPQASSSYISIVGTMNAFVSQRIYD